MLAAQESEDEEKAGPLMDEKDLKEAEAAYSESGAKMKALLEKEANGASSPACEVGGWFVLRLSLRGGHRYGCRR